MPLCTHSTDHHAGLPALWWASSSGSGCHGWRPSTQAPCTCPGSLASPCTGPQVDRPPDILHLKGIDEDFVERLYGGVETQCRHAVLRHFKRCSQLEQRAAMRKEVQGYNELLPHCVCAMSGAFF
jgi:hypothetical protein